MSEYLYYEFQTIDRLLTEAEQAEVEELSSHIEVTASRAVVTYSYGDFRHDPKQVLSRYFDACLYAANWGTRRLLFRFPQGLSDSLPSSHTAARALSSLQDWALTRFWKWN